MKLNVKTNTSLNMRFHTLPFINCLCLWKGSFLQNTRCPPHSLPHSLPEKMVAAPHYLTLEYCPSTHWKICKIKYDIIFEKWHRYILDILSVYKLLRYIFLKRYCSPKDQLLCSTIQMLTKKFNCTIVDKAIYFFCLV